MKKIKIISKMLICIIIISAFNVLFVNEKIIANEINQTEVDVNELWLNRIKEKDCKKVVSNQSLDNFLYNEELNEKSNRLLYASGSQSIASSFDLRTKINITVKNQADTGLCWAFAALGALRTHYSLVYNQDYDFSESHLDYITSKEFNEDNSRERESGGTWNDASKYFSSNYGPVLASQFPFKKQVSSEEKEEILKLKPVVNVNNFKVFPVISKKRQDDGTVKCFGIGNKELSESSITMFRNAVKKHIINNGGIYAGIRTHENFIGNNVGYENTEGAFSQFDDGSINDSSTGGHAVVIIGWDDNYSRDLFHCKNKEGEYVKPEHNGAYLCLNSYSESWGEGGYQWISYDDAEIEYELAGFLDGEQEDNILENLKIEYDPPRENGKSRSVDVIISSQTEDLLAIDGWEYVNDAQGNINRKIKRKVATSGENILTVYNRDCNCKNVNVNIDWIDDKVDKLKITYDPPRENGPTIGSVTAIVSCDTEDLKEVNGWTYLDGNKKKIKKEFNQSVIESIIVEDMFGNQTRQEIQISWIDLEPPGILNVQRCYNHADNTELVLITADEPIVIKNSKTTQEYILDVDSSWLDLMKSCDPNINDKVNLKNSVLLKYYKNNPNEIVTIADDAGNEITQNLSIESIDEIGPDIQIQYQTGGNTYNTNNYSTNEDVTVIVTSNEEIKEIAGWTRSNNKKQLTKTYSVNMFPQGTKETIEVMDIYSNKTKANIRVKIDTEAPYIVSPKEDVSSDNRTLTVNVTFNEECTIISGDGWQKPLFGGPNTIAKTYTNPTSADGEKVTIKDIAGNEYEFEIKVRIVDGILIAHISDIVSPILEKIIYGTTMPTNKNVRVTLITNERIQEVDEWDLQEGTGEYENKWILTKLYYKNFDETIEIVDIDGNKIVGNNTTNNSVTDGKVKIKITNIDKEAPKINNYEIIPESGTNNVAVTLTASETVKVLEGTNWKILNSGNGIGTKITGTIEKGSIEILKIADVAENIAYFAITCNQAGTDLTIKEGALVESIEKLPKRKTNSTVRVGITVNKKIGKINNQNITSGQSIDGWTLINGIAGDENRSYISKEFLENGDYFVQIEDISGNKVIGEDIVDGTVSFSVDNIVDETEIKEVSSIEIEQFPKSVYYQGDLLDLSELVVRVNYVDGSSEPINYSENSGFEIIKDGSRIQSNYILTEVGPRQMIIINYGDDNSAMFYILVNELKIDELNIKTNPTKTSYIIGETLNTQGLTLTAVYNNGKTEIITDGFIVQEISLDSVGTKWVEVSYREESTSFKITVEGKIEKTVRRLQIKKWPGLYAIYTEGEKLDISDLELKIIYSDGSSEDILYSDRSEEIEITPIKLETVVEPIITIKYGGKSIDVGVTVLEKTLVGLRIIDKPTKKIYNIGEQIDLTGIQLEATYNNGQSERINDTQLEEYKITCSPNAVSNSGIKNIAVNYKQLSTVFEVNVLEPAIQAISVVKEPLKTKYVYGEIFKRQYLDGLVVEAIYSDGHKENIDMDELEVSNLEFDTIGTKNINISYQGKETNFSVDVAKLQINITGINKLPNKTTYEIGDDVSIAGLELNAETEYGNEVIIDASLYKNITFSPNKVTKSGSQTITVQYENDSVTFDVDVRNKDNDQQDDEKQDGEKQDGDKQDDSKQDGEKQDGDKQDDSKQDDGKQVDGKQDVDKQDDGKQNDGKQDDDKTDEEKNKATEDIKNDNKNDKNVNKQENNNKGNQNNSDKSKQESEIKNNQNDADNIYSDNNERGNSNKDLTVAPNEYKDANTANSRLPQTGIPQIIVGILIISAMVSGALFLKYRKM